MKFLLRSASVSELWVQQTMGHFGVNVCINYYSKHNLLQNDPQPLCSTQIKFRRQMWSKWKHDSLQVRIQGLKASERSEYLHQESTTFSFYC